MNGGYDPATPLDREKYERFAQAMAAGNDLARAWNLVSGVETRGARQSAFRVSQRPDVAARIVWLRQQRQVTPSDSGVPSKDALSSLFQEITESFERLHTLASEIGAAHSVRTKIMRAITVHVGRSNRRTRDDRPTPKAAPDADLSEYLNRLPICGCRT